MSVNVMELKEILIEMLLIKRTFYLGKLSTFSGKRNAKNEFFMCDLSLKTNITRAKIIFLLTL